MSIPSLASCPSAKAVDCFYVDAIRAAVNEQRHWSTRKRFLLLDSFLCFFLKECLRNQLPDNIRSMAPGWKRSTSSRIYSRWDILFKGHK